MRQKQPVKQWFRVMLWRLGEDKYGYKLLDLTTNEFLPEVYMVRSRAAKERAKLNREKNSTGQMVLGGWLL